MSDANWMITGFPAELRQRVVQAARKRGVPVADWLTALLMQPGVIDGNAVESVQLLPRARSDGPPPTLSELVTCAVALASSPNVSQRLRHVANRAVRERYAALLGPPQANRRQIAAPAQQADAKSQDSGPKPLT